MKSVKDMSDKELEIYGKNEFTKLLLGAYNLKTMDKIDIELRRRRV